MKLILKHYLIIWNGKIEYFYYDMNYIYIYIYFKNKHIKFFFIKIFI